MSLCPAPSHGSSLCREHSTTTHRRREISEVNHTTQRILTLYRVWPLANAWFGFTSRKVVLNPEGCTHQLSPHPAPSLPHPRGCSSQPCRAPSLPYLWSSAAAADSCTCDIPPQASASTNPGRVWQELLNFWCSGAWETTRSERQGKSEKATTWKKKKGLVLLKFSKCRPSLCARQLKHLPHPKMHLFNSNE